jgi:hypothetical protein
MATVKTDTASGRYYDIPGVGKLPSVTTILRVVSKPALVPWAKNVALERVREGLRGAAFPPDGGKEYLAWADEIIAAAKKRPDEVRDEAADFGTRTHALIEKYLKLELGAELTIPEDLEPVFSNFVEWQQGAGLTFVDTEMTVWYSERHRYAGTLDVLAEDSDGQPVVVDIKTSSGIYPEMAMQVAAYSVAYGTRSGREVAAAYVVRLGKKKPEFEVKEVDIYRAMHGFRGAMNLWYALEEKKLWR